MSVKIALIGSKGNMGKRYETILKYRGHEVVGFDLGDTINLDDSYHSIIIATPTDTHYMQIMELSKFGLPILCEKPIVKSLLILERLLNSGAKIRMVNQYQYLVDNDPLGSSYYDYFKSGGDGLAWDCINIIGLAHDVPFLANNSPIWKCSINGKELSISQMDQAYIDMLDDWVSNPTSNHDYILTAHQKVHAIT
jgi:hypothetical protein